MPNYHCDYVHLMYMVLTKDDLQFAQIHQRCRQVFLIFCSNIQTVGTQTSSTVIRSQSNRATLVCGGIENLHHGRAVEKATTTV